MPTVDCQSSMKIDIDSGRVELWRDKYGVPHIRSRRDDDAFFGLGYAHARDRLWQMEMLRRKGEGRWAEWIGPAGIEPDTFARRIGAKRAAIRDLGNLGPEARQMLEAYARGVNAFIAKGEFPIEYKILDTLPEPWLPWHSIVVMRQIGFLIGASFWMKLFRAYALPIVGPRQVSKLRYEDGGIDRVCMPSNLEAKRWPMDNDALRSAIEALLAIAPPDVVGGGSNNWAVSGQLSASGSPILMGDPHRELDVPIIYAQAHLTSDNFDVIGLTVPGVPGFPHIAHNECVAWGVTVAFFDLHDLYIEKFRNDGAEHLASDGWTATTRRTETLGVRGQLPVDIEIFETGNGPVVVGDPRTSAALSVRSAQFDEGDRSFDCMVRMMRARTVSELYEATRGWGLVDHNLVAIDVEGNIGHRVRARVPRRRRENGWLPVPGWLKEFHWDRFLDFEDMPAVINPAQAFIVTANNRVVPDNADFYFCTDCHPSHRARRIEQQLSDSIDRSSERMQEIFADELSLPARLFQSRLRTMSVTGDRQAELRAQLLHWDCRMRGDSVPAAIYSRMRLHLTHVMAEKSGLLDGRVLKEAAPLPFVITQLWWVIPNLLRDDDATMLGNLSWQGALQEALDRTARDDQQGMTWAQIHTPELRHPLSAAFPDMAGMLDPPCAAVGGDSDTVMSTGYLAGAGLRCTYSSLARYTFDPADWVNSSWIVFQGAEEAPGAPHRSDQNELWAACRSLPMLYDWKAIKADATLISALTCSQGSVSA